MAYQWNLPDPRLSVDDIDRRRLQQRDTCVRTLHELAQAISDLEKHFQRLLETPVNTVHAGGADTRKEN